MGWDPAFLDALARVVTDEIGRLLFDYFHEDGSYAGAEPSPKLVKTCVQALINIRVLSLIARENGGPWTRHCRGNDNSSPSDLIGAGIPLWLDLGPWVSKMDEDYVEQYKDHFWDDFYFLGRIAFPDEEGTLPMPLAPLAKAGSATRVDICDHCHKTPSDGGKLKRCGRCKVARFSAIRVRDLRGQSTRLDVSRLGRSERASEDRIGS
jgi:hypothetical protein